MDKSEGSSGQVHSPYNLPPDAPRPFPMPHTSRRRAPPSRKRTQLSADGWTYITSTRPMASLSPPPALPLSNPESTATPPSNSSLDTLSKLSKDFERLESIWLSSACRASVLRIIQDGKDDAGTITTSSVCLGLGSLSTEGRRRSLFQLIALMDINKSLGRTIFRRLLARFGS